MSLDELCLKLTGLRLNERGSKSELARICDVPRETVYTWIRRGSVPPGYLKFMEHRIEDRTSELQDKIDKIRDLTE